MSPGPTSLENWPLSAHARNRLRDNGITTKEQLLSKTEVDLLRLNGFGRLSLVSVKAALKGYRLKLKGHGQ